MKPSASSPIASHFTLMFMSRDTTITFLFGFSLFSVKAVPIIWLSAMSALKPIGKCSALKAPIRIRPFPFRIRTPFWRFPLERRLSKVRIIFLACAPTPSWRLLCLSISSRTFSGIKMSLFLNVRIASASVK